MSRHFNHTFGSTPLHSSPYGQSSINPVVVDNPWNAGALNDLEIGLITASRLDRQKLKLLKAFIVSLEDQYDAAAPVPKAQTTSTGSRLFIPVSQPKADPLIAKKNTVVVAKPHISENREEWCTEFDIGILIPPLRHCFVLTVGDVAIDKHFNLLTPIYILTSSILEISVERIRGDIEQAIKTFPKQDLLPVLMEMGTVYKFTNSDVKELFKNNDGSLFYDTPRRNSNKTDLQKLIIRVETQTAKINDIVLRTIKG